MAPPVALFQVRKTFKQFRRTSSFYAPHYFARCHVGWRRYQNMHMILTDDALQYLYFKGFTRLPNQFPYSQPYVTFQHLITIFRYKYKMVLYLENRMTAVTIFELLSNLVYRESSGGLFLISCLLNAVYKFNAIDDIC